MCRFVGGRGQGQNLPCLEDIVFLWVAGCGSGACSLSFGSSVASSRPRSYTGAPTSSRQSLFWVWPPPPCKTPGLRCLEDTV